MSRRIGSLLVVVVCVTVAGCVGGLPGAPQADPTAGGGGSGGEASGGDDSAGSVANRTALLAAAGSYTSTWEMRVTEGGTVVSETAYTTAVDYASGRSTFSATTVTDGRATDGWETYVADGTSYTRYGQGETASYTVGPGVFTGTTPVDTGRFVTAGSDLAEFTRTGTEAYDSVRVTRYELTERPAWVAAGQVAGGEVRWTAFTFEVLVDDDGLVRLERWTSTGTDGEGVTHTVEFTASVTGVGSTTVEEPAWVETARAQA